MMNLKRPLVLVSVIVTAVVAAIAPVTVQAASQTADLRVYGTVTASFSPGEAVFTCLGPGHADILFGKLLADMFWDATGQVTQSTAQIAGHAVIVREWKPFGAAIVVRVGSKVVAFGGDSVADVIGKATEDSHLFSGDVAVSPLKPYPQTLDFYDNKAVKFYTEAMASPRGLGLNSHWPFVNQFGLGGIAFQNLSFSDSCAPGVISWGPSDYEVSAAQGQNGMLVPSFDAAGDVPFWMHNEFPDTIAQPDPDALMEGWHMPSLSNLFCESFGVPQTIQDQYFLGFMRQVIGRYGNSPAIGGWQIYAGEPGAELGFHDRATENLDYSALGEMSFRIYLKQIRGYTLQQLGQRWFNDPAHYTSWDQVQIPDNHGFFGDLNSSSFRIKDGWLRVEASGAGPAIPADTANWVPVDLTPSKEQLTFPELPAYYKVAFDASTWMTTNAGKSDYLVCDTGDFTDKGMHLWLNGKDCGTLQSVNDMRAGPMSMDVTGLLHSGVDQLVVMVSGEGKIMGPVFLTTTKPVLFPNLGAERNAQYMDFNSWQRYAIYSVHDEVFREARQIDPDRALGLGSDEFGDMGGEVADLAVDYGVSVQNTGREAWYFPWWPGLGYVDDFYATSEPSGTPDVDSLTRMLSWILFDGDSSTILFQNIEDFQKMERDSGWFTAHKAALQLEGKALREKPQIALLRSTTTAIAGDGTQWGWDIGRGELQADHLDNVYVTEREILNGKIDSYPVLFDCASSFTDPQVVDAIGRYVRQGGTFVAIQFTGANTTTQPGSWPITQLTGFTVKAQNETGQIKFAQNLPVLQSWSGQSYWNGQGCLSLASTGEGAVPLAQWPDGTVAVGYRKVGSGQVIVLGGDFWRNGGNIASLFTDLGVKRNTTSDSSDLWTRKFITKNGQQNWVVAYNNGGEEVTSSVSMSSATAPDMVWDMESGQSVPFTYADGMVTIPNVSIAPRENRVFGIRRAGLVDGLPTWWDEKVRYWKKISLANPVPTLATDVRLTPADPSGMDAVATDQWRCKTVPDPNDETTDWEMPGFNDSSWRSISNGPWNLQGGDLATYSGRIDYRYKFIRPASWARHKIVLCLHGLHVPIIYGHGEFTINGQSEATYDYTIHDGEYYYYDVTDSIKPGENVLGLKITSGSSFNGYGGIGGVIWLQPETKLSEPIEITSGWNVVGQDRRTAVPAVFPGTVNGKYLARDITIPANYSGKPVFLHVESASQWLGLVMINDRPIYFTGYGQNYPTRFDLNLAPFVKPGQVNHLELWPNRTMPRDNGQPAQQTTDIPVSEMRIGYVAP